MESKIFQTEKNWMSKNKRRKLRGSAILSITNFFPQNKHWTKQTTFKCLGIYISELDEKAKIVWRVKRILYRDNAPSHLIFSVK